MENYLLVLIIVMIILFLADKVRGFISSPESKVVVIPQSKAVIPQSKADIKLQMDIEYQMSRLESKLITYPGYVEKGYKIANGAAFVLFNIPRMLDEKNLMIRLGHFNNARDVIAAASQKRCFLFTWGGNDPNNALAQSMAYGFNNVAVLRYMSVVPNDYAVSGYGR